MSDPFLESYLRECLQTARHALDAYDAAITAAPDDQRRHQMVRFAEQSRMRVDILLRVIHQHGFTATADPGPPEAATKEDVWWQHVCRLWAAEYQAFQQVVILQSLSTASDGRWLPKALNDLEPSLGERLHALEAHTRDSAARLAQTPLPAA